MLLNTRRNKWCFVVRWADSLDTFYILYFYDNLINNSFHICSIVPQFCSSNNNNNNNEIFRPLGYETSLVVIRRANSIAMLYICLTLSAVMGLHEQWRSRKLRDIIRKLFNLLSPRTVYIKRLIWPLTDFERCLRYFDTQGKQTSHTNTGYHWCMLWHHSVVDGLCQR